MAPKRGTVFMLPGITCTELAIKLTPPLPAVRLWFPATNPSGLVALTFLQFAGGSMDPQYPLPGPIVTKGYQDNTYQRLLAQLAGNWSTESVYLDWRFDLTTQATSFVNQLVQGSYPKPWYLIGHSMGGLVARLAWQQWNTTHPGNTDFGRIVTVGTPHWGSYAVMQAFAHLNRYFQLLKTISVLGAGGEQTRALQSKLDFIIGSWPSVYQLLPNPARPTGPRDPGNTRLFVSTNYGKFNRAIQQFWLTSAATLGTALSQAASQPAFPLLVCVGGSGYSTVATLAATGSLADEGNYTSTDGDTVVTASCALLGSAIDFYYCDHANLCNAPGFLDKIDDYLQFGLPAADSVRFFTSGLGSNYPDRPFNESLKGDVFPPPVPSQGQVQGPNVVQVPVPVPVPQMGTPGCPGVVVQNP